MCAIADSYVNGGQDWGLTTPGCVTNASSSQSPINVADQVVTYGATLAPLNVSYGKTASWMLEITGACDDPSPKSSRRVRGTRVRHALRPKLRLRAVLTPLQLCSQLPGGG